jgi:DNA-binding MarR family transcriptional regulator
MPADPAPPRLMAPQTIDDLLLYQMGQMLAVCGGIVIRYCEGRFGITRREWRVLALLADRGPLGSSELAAQAQLDRPRTSKAVTALVRKKLVSRTPRAGDARYIGLALTPAGQALYDELFPVVAQVNRDVLAALSVPEVAQLDDMLARLHRRSVQMVAGAELPLADRRRGGSARHRRAG